MVKTINILLFFAFLCIFTACESEKSNPVAQVTKKRLEGTIIALGDSLTAGLGVELDESYPSLLQQRLESEGYGYRVVNAGVSGETSSGTLSRLNWILSQTPDIVILEIGANDGLRGIDTVLVEKNLREILRVLQEKGVITILAGMKMVWNLGEEYTKRFNGVYSKLAEETEVIYMPFFLDGVAADPVFNGKDGLHPNEKGYKVILENLYPYVLKAIEKHTQQQQQ